MTTTYLPIDQLIGLCFTLGLLIPVLIVSLAGGYILGGFILSRFSKTVLGTHVRHVFTRIAPAKRFEEGDQSFIHSVILADLQSGSSKIRALLKDQR